MHVYFERCSNARSDCIILSLSWMSKASEETSEDVAWKYHRFNSYDEGWLSTGNAKGIVSATFTTCHCMKLYDAPARTNYNLRGHRSEVILVKWNEPFQKLATCDKTGIIFVWIKYEGRWSIELINDRNTQVTDFSWSHDGRMALICYKDGFVLVGSVAGQRFWSSMLNLESTITCGSWSPSDQQVLFGTSDGQIIVMDVHGAMVAQVSVFDEMEITAMEWSCEKFRIDDTDGDDFVGSEKPSVLAVSYANGHIHIMKNYDDVSPIILLTGLKGVKMEWSNDGELLAVAGVAKTSQIDHVNMLQFYTSSGYLRYSVQLSYTQHPVSALTWGHKDKRLFVATGPQIHIAWVTKIIGSLQLLSRFAIHSFLKDPCSTHKLSLPRQLRSVMSSMNIPTLTGYIPDPQKLREFVSRPPPGNERLHCTMLRNDDEITLGCASYTLFLEYLGGLVPLLKGKRTSKIRPEFAIYDPKFPENLLIDLTAGSLTNCHTGAAVASSGCSSSSDISDSEIGDGCASPRMQRKRRRRKKSRDLEREQCGRTGDDPALGDCLATEKLVEVTSNIWGTKFKIHGFATFLPANLGQVNYKTSLLHLQPRQMTIIITELRDDLQPDKDPNFNPNAFSEDEDDFAGSLHGSDSEQYGSPQHGGSIPIAPMSPVKHSPSSLSRTHLIQRPTPSYGSFYPSRQPAQGYMSGPADGTIDDLTQQMDDISNEFPYVDLTASPQFLQFQEQRNSQNQAFMVDINQVPDRTKAVTNGTLPKMWPGRNKKVADSYDSNSDSDVLEFMQINHEHSSYDMRIPDGLPPQPNGIPRWADKVGELKYIDEDNNDDSGQDKNKNGALHSFSGVAIRKHRSRSVGHLSNLEAAVLQDFPNVTLRDGQTRFTITQLKNNKPKPKLKLCGKSRSLDSGTCDVDKIELETPVCGFPEKLGSNNYITLEKVQNVIKWSAATDQNGISDLQTMQSTKLKQSSRIDCCENFADNSPPPSPSTQKSSPSTSPLHRLLGRDSSPSPGRRNILQSPLLHRKVRRTRQVESSDDEVTLSGDEVTTCQNYKDLESFQKAHIRQKLKKARSRSEGSERSPSLPRQREFVMHNKAPLWNETSQVYQLDFGGRVTQESAKNFQIEFKGKQVMQFGRIDGNAYTLDFQYPFTALQAFAVALANVTQRLK